MEGSLLIDHKINEILQALLLDNFFEIGQKTAVCNYPEGLVLEDFEIELLEEIIRVVGNFAHRDAAGYVLIQDGFAEQLFVIVRDFKEQFDYKLWHLFIWAFRMLASKLEL